MSYKEISIYRLVLLGRYEDEPSCEYEKQKSLFIVTIILMFGTAITEFFTGQWIDVLLRNVTQANMAAYTGANATPEMTNAGNGAKAAAGPEIINVTLIIPLILIVSFIGLNVYLKKRRIASLQGAVA